MRSWFLLAALLFAGCASSQNQPIESKKYNVLMIAVDDMNDWLGCMQGHPNAKTPNMDKLAARSTLFMNAHCQAPLCGPSRASLMSGLLPSTTGIYGQISDKNIRRENKVTAKAVFLPEYFAGQGYKTMGIGKLFHGHAPKGVFELSGGRIWGFGPNPPQRLNWPTAEINEKVFKAQKYRTSTDWGAFPDKDERMPDFKSAAWTIAKLKQKHDEPFFLAAGFLRPHVPWHVPQKWFDLHPLESIELPPYLKNDQADVPVISRRLHEMPQMPTAEWARQSGEWKKIIQAYLACISFVDYQVGEVLRALEESDYADNTIVILWSDHGYHMGEKNRFAKHSLWNEATQVPLIISMPGGKKQVCHKPVQLLDLYPTLVDLCGLPPNKALEGHSLKPLLENSEEAWEHAALTTYVRHNHKVSTEKYRYISYEDGSEELYDYTRDPNEWHNLAGDKNYVELKQRLRAHLPQVNRPWAKHSYYRTNDFFDGKMKSRKK